MGARSALFLLTAAGMALLAGARSMVDGWQHIAGIAPGDSNYWTVVSDSWYLGQDNRPGYYRACFAPWNAVVNNYPYYNCTGWQSVR